MTHTPGKWQVVGGTVIVSKSLDKMIASVPEESVSLSFDETRANARLIAAAPELAAALDAIPPLGEPLQPRHYVKIKQALAQIKE